MAVCRKEQGLWVPRAGSGVLSCHFSAVRLEPLCSSLKMGLVVCPQVLNHCVESHLQKVSS